MTGSAVTAAATSIWATSTSWPAPVPGGDGDQRFRGAVAFDADGWYRTGDVAVVDDAGMHRIVGRESVDLIKSGGYRIGAGEIETALLGHPGVAEAAVVGMPDEDLGQRIVAFVVPAGRVNPDDLIDHVAQQLSIHKRPREVRVVDALPRNAMGKVLKKQLLSDG